MSKYIDADKLKAEITKHYDEYKAKFHQNGERYYLGLIDGIEMTKRIIDSLQQEQSAVIATPFIQTKPCEGQEMSVSSEEEQPCDTCTNDKGCVTCKDGELWEGKEQLSEDLEEVAEEKYPVYWKDYPKDGIVRSESSYDTNKKCRDAFITGAEWQKAQMLKDAVEGEVCGRVYDHINVRFADGVSKYLEPKNISHIPADISKYTVGDKVKIVIIADKEE